MKLLSAPRSPYDDFVKELFQFAVIIEKDQPYKKALINNSTSSKTNDSMKQVDYIYVVSKLMKRAIVIN